MAVTPAPSYVIRKLVHDSEPDAQGKGKSGGLVPSPTQPTAMNPPGVWEAMNRRDSRPRPAPGIGLVPPRQPWAGRFALRCLGRRDLRRDGLDGVVPSCPRPPPPPPGLVCKQDSAL